MASDCALGRPERQLTQGIQVIEPPPETQEDIDIVWRPVTHRSALQQATGEAVYIDDMPIHEGMPLKTEIHDSFDTTGVTGDRRYGNLRCH